ncbi:MAG: hypothetical protein Q9P90_09135 [candidate division KSB1 bacterium]|nr:hypothetical protein [candidate division KSB1 bacterium]
MNWDWQTWLTIAIVVVAAIYTLSKTVLQFVREDRGPACSKCVQNQGAPPKPQGMVIPSHIKKSIKPGTAKTPQQ